MNKCLKDYCEKNPKDAFRAEMYAQSILKAAVSERGDSLSVSVSPDYKHDRAFKTLNSRTPNINKGRPFFSKIGAKIKGLWNKDYGALNYALAEVQKDAKANPTFYMEAIKNAPSMGNGMTRIDDIAHSASHLNTITNQQYKLTESYRSKENADQRAECSKTLENVANAMEAYKVQHPKDAMRAERHVLKTLRAYAYIDGHSSDSVLDKIYLPSDKFESKDSSYNLTKGTPSVTKNRSFFGKLATKMRSSVYAFNAEKELNKCLRDAVKSIKKNPSMYGDVLKDVYNNAGEPRMISEIAADAKAWSKSADKRHEESHRVPLQKQLEKVQEGIYRGQQRDHALAQTRAPQNNKMSDKMLAKVLSGYKKSY